MEFKATVLYKTQATSKGTNQPTQTRVGIALDGEHYFSDVELETMNGGALRSDKEFVRFVESLNHGDKVTITIALRK